MDEKQIQAILEKAISTALTGSNPQSAPTTTDNNQVSMALGKAIEALNAKIDNLEKVAVKQEPETVESQVSKLAKIVEELGNKIEKIGKGETEEEEKPLENLTTKSLNKMIEDVIANTLNKNNVKKPKGEKTDDLSKIIGGASDDEEIEIDFENVETEDAAGNTLSKEKRVKRAELDNFFGKIISNKLQSRGLVENDDDDEDDD